jgi:hypothetical protein
MNQTIRMLDEAGERYTFLPNGVVRRGGVVVGRMSRASFEDLAERVSAGRRRGLPVRVVGIERKPE